MASKYNFSQISKVLEKIFKAGFNTEKDILAFELNDVQKVPDLANAEILIIIELKKAIKSKKIIAFLSGYEERNGIENEKI